MGRKKSLKRKTGTRPERRTFLVFTEGKLTEPTYINGLKSLDMVRRNTGITVEVREPHVVPMSLVRAAVAAADREIDQVWCVFDVESPQPHPNLKEAVALAAKEGVHVAISNPCFELWLTLHDRAHRRAVTTDEAVALANKLAGVEKKAITDVGWFLERRAAAIARAEELDAMHKRNGTTFPKTNPSCGVPLLLQALERTSGA